jgi:glycerol-3-phosphate cytidylyltransferase
MVIGYTTGVFDLFHVGHVALLQRARSMCDRLIVGVSTDDLVSYKHKRPVIPFTDRIEVVRSCRHVDLVVPQYSMDKVDAFERYRFNIMFVGDDWFKSEKWNETESLMTARGVRVIYFPYTKGTSSTLINMTLEQLRIKE